jgi:hypothetical protein
MDINFIERTQTIVTGVSIRHTVFGIPLNIESFADGSLLITVNGKSVAVSKEDSDAIIDAIVTARKDK